MAVTSSLSLWVYTFSVSQIVKLVNCDIKSVDKSPLIDCCHVNWLPFCECHLWQRKTFSVTKSFNLWLWKVWTRQNDRNIIHQRPNSEESHFPRRTGSRLCSIARLKINTCQFLFCVQGGADIPHHPYSSSIVLWGGGVAVSSNWDLNCWCSTLLRPVPCCQQPQQGEGGRSSGRPQRSQGNALLPATLRRRSRRWRRRQQPGPWRRAAGRLRPEFIFCR